MTDTLRTEALAARMTADLFRKYGGHVTQFDLALELEHLYTAIRKVVPPEKADPLIAELRATWRKDA